MTAFVLGAGLGTRLRPLTEGLPKPLIPVGRKPLITFAFDHLIAEAGVERFIVNTHHAAEAYTVAFPNAAYRGRPIHPRHEPILLETAGGMKNISDLLPPGESFIVYNGDILTDLPLKPSIEQHRSAGCLATLILRTARHPGDPCHVACDPATRRVLDIRNALGTNVTPRHLFTGIYLVRPAFLDLIPPATKLSVIPIFLDMLRRGETLGAALAEEGLWRDLGTRDEYLRVHRDLQSEHPPRFPRYGAADPSWRQWIDPAARIGPGAKILGACVVGPGARLGEGAVIEDSILWERAEVASRGHLQRCIVRAHRSVSGEHADADF